MKRVNKYITEAGYCSRREADKYIEQGRVTVNGHEVDLGAMIGDGDVVEVDGERVSHHAKQAVYIAFNKPVGVTCTTDPEDDTNIVDFIGYKERIFPVGRLDKDSQGLILLTNDGDIVNRILRAGNNHPKEYVVTLDRPMTAEFTRGMSQGVRILGVKTKPCVVHRQSETTFTIQLTQGLNRQIRRMAQALGYKVTRLKRVKVLNIALGNLEPGRWRYLTPQETLDMLALLADSSGTEEASSPGHDAPRRPAQRRTTGSVRSDMSVKSGNPARQGPYDSDVTPRPRGAKPSKQADASNSRGAKSSAGASGSGTFSQYRKRGTKRTEK